MMMNAGLHKPDGIIFDLEDSVSADKKFEARILVRNALRELDFYGAERMVRINRMPMGMDDLDCIIPQAPDLVLVPKVEEHEQIRIVDSRINEIQNKTAKNEQIYLMPIIESALGIENAYKIARASGRIVAMAIGLEDYTADLGVTRTEEGSESFYARARLINACKAAGIQAIDSVYSDVEDVAGLRRTALKSRALGFEGMGCIHPRQIETVRKVYQPLQEEVDMARKIVLAFEEAGRNGNGVTTLGSRMIDAPVVKRALRTIELAVQLGMISKKWRTENE